MSKSKGHFTHKTMSPWPLHFKHSYWWKRQSWSKFASHYALREQRSMWMQDGCKSLHGFLHGIKWIVFYGHLDYFQKPPLGSRPNTKPRDHGTPNAHNRWFILFYYVWGPAWIEIHWNSICLFLELSKVYTSGIIMLFCAACLAVLNIIRFYFS
jgi:hypothetical protein